MKIETEALYQLMDVAIGEFVKDNTLVMPSKAVRYFTSMLYGATRGILACKLEGTPLASIVLPPDNLDKIITNPLVIPIGNMRPPLFCFISITHHTPHGADRITDS